MLSRVCADFTSHRRDRLVKATRGHTQAVGCEANRHDRPFVPLECFHERPVGDVPDFQLAGARQSRLSGGPSTGQQEGPPSGAKSTPWRPAISGR